ncbi:hypothetical protein [Novosphingobium terrae]|uniref:hypothetical protein n=1 Tax=Novosphingobium terrae TaxID=2726189 RepID=UPI001980B086|nr:hypothetical protein [Novosphingobium terrae]
MTKVDVAAVAADDQASVLIQRLKAQLPAQLPACLLASIAIVTALTLRGMPLSHDVVWQFWIARQLLGGSQLYLDIWEVNPPLWFWTAMPIRLLAQALHVPPLQLLVMGVVALGALSAWLVGHLAGYATPSRLFVAMLMTFWLVVIGPLSDFAQREHLALICAVPYAALLARRTWASAGEPSKGCAVLVALMAAYGFALKHYFVAIPVLLELWLIVRMRREWRLLRPETTTLTLVALVYAIGAVMVTPAFFQQYSTDDPRWLLWLCSLA